MTTCFRPTPHRDLHLGSVWNAFQNWFLARQTGGQFVLMFDDLAFDYGHCWSSGWPLEVMQSRYLEDLEWFGIVPDRIEFSSTNRERHRWAQEKLGYRPYVRFANLTAWTTPRIPSRDPDNFGDRSCAKLHPNEAPLEAIKLAFYPPYMAECLVDDHDFGVTGYVMGRDLLPLWAWIMDAYERLGFACPYIGWHRTLKYSTIPGKISKSAEPQPGVRENTVRNLREVGYDPDRIIETILECLVVSCEAEHEQTIIPGGVLTCEEVAYLEYRNRQLEDLLDRRAWADPPEPWMESVQVQIPYQLPLVTKVTLAADHRARKAS